MAAAPSCDLGPASCSHLIPASGRVAAIAASPAYAEVKFRFLLSEPPESTSRSDINENGHDRARLPSIMKRRQDLPEKRHLLHPEDEVFEESFVLDPLSSLPPERRASHKQVEDVFVESEHKKRRRRGRRRSG
ncbi:hypothetical protein ANCCAN_11730 [Ancylostoma caninum]|uniref:Uncharacterized protein n=1 Tax=Ancylostoma caninum TaxID=29170 RepID=A0A368GCZ7_ANCCA|nr:hypothetical protein ANCCAN_11730 [Ancylostoma caninum]